MSITFDAITGADQNKKKLWERILEQYKQHIGVPTERNYVGLMNCWSVMQPKISKFSGCMTTIEMNRPSGFSNDDMMITAKDLFRSQTGGEFKLESCWEILKHNNKWNSHCAKQVGKGKKKKEPKKRSGFDFDINESGHSLPSTPSSHATTTDGASTKESPHIGENDSPGVEEYQQQRPVGRKAAKQRRAKINSANELQTSFVSKFNNITTRFESR
ncbi:glutathione S-transferase T2-like [Cornus florida]|uniref:glutathione S-transferase T2-like n=1 Tax=Cornus florida TaxID=4283 RepID=UPI002897B6BD|nr:glutathione S-transferase T2-like [Cornus florida]